MGYRVEVFDKNLRRVGEIDEWISLDFTVRLVQAGIWQLLIKDDTPQAKLIEKGGGVAIYQDGVVKPILSGQVDVFQKYWTTVQHTGPGSLYIGGKCHNQLAYRRLAFPDPLRPITEQYKVPKVRHVHNAPTAGQLLFRELDMAMGPSALPDRRVAGLNLVDRAIGIHQNDVVRWDVLGSKFEEWCDRRTIAYRLIYNPTTQKVDLDLFQPRDRSKDVRFSTELGNLREYIWTLNAPRATRAIVGCAGEGQNRYYYQKVDSASEAEWGISHEIFVDRRDIQVRINRGTGQPAKNDEEMTDAEFKAALEAAKEAAAEALAEGEKDGNFQIYPIDTEDCAFGRDYFVGDIVTVAVDGIEYSDVVREVVVSVDDGGKATDIKPKIGQQGSGEPLNLYKTVFDMQRKLRKLEARM
ncbi:Gp37-like protein [Streptomyces buecherae]|uniref:Gp37-like protein n=1 Tax=Streptomyces buecherae TaxID=2763006 RepID=UPI0037A2D5B5